MFQCCNKLQKEGIHMSQKFHINKHGVPSPCRAKAGNCPLGGEEQHFSNQANAQAYADKINEQEYGLMSQMKSSSSGDGGGKSSNPMSSDFDSVEEAQEQLDKSITEEYGIKEKKLTPAQLRRQEKKEFEERLSNVLDTAWGGDQKMINHCIKSSKYVEVDGSFVEIGNSKPFIKKELWYDDETEVPEVNYETFYNHNASDMPKYYEKKANYMLEGRGTLKMVPQYGGKDLDLTTLTYDPKPDGPYREVTNEELKKINEGVDEVRKDFEKRIKTYYKRNKDEITVRGYWANR